MARFCFASRISFCATVVFPVEYSSSNGKQCLNWLSHFRGPPHSKKGVPSLPEELKLINLRHFAFMMERLAGLLDSIDMATRHLLESQTEWEELEKEWGEEMALYMGDDENLS
jgi:hypothetical protein